jgi:hypothetical protein
MHHGLNVIPAARSATFSALFCLAVPHFALSGTHCRVPSGGELDRSTFFYPDDYQVIDDLAGYIVLAHRQTQHPPLFPLFPRSQSTALTSPP